MLNLLEMMFGPSATATAEHVIDFLHAKTVARADDLKWILENEPLADNATAKGLVCRLSAMLHEMDAERAAGSDLIERLFETHVDIEHIESVNHHDESLREAVWSEWQGELHRVGNLMLLERDMNRSISNGNYVKTKLAAYARSGFAVAKMQARGYAAWDLAACLHRKTREIDSLLGYLTSPGLKTWIQP